MSSSSSKRGRPKAPRAVARPNRVVTFVTDKERVLLQQYCEEEDRSMAAAVHRIIKAHFEKTKDEV